MYAVVQYSITKIPFNYINIYLETRTKIKIDSFGVSAPQCPLQKILWAPMKVLYRDRDISPFRL